MTCGSIAHQATVIGRNPDRWHEMLTINKGSMGRKYGCHHCQWISGKVKQRRIYRFG
jgi:hypothetical protein